MEIERKFIVPGDEAAEFSKEGNPNIIIQYYTELSPNSEKRRRMIITQESINCYETVKTGTGLVRQEEEYPITTEEFNSLLLHGSTQPQKKKNAKRMGSVIKKFRTKIEKDGYIFELDFYGNPTIFYPDGRLASVVEIEFESEESAKNFDMSKYFREFIDVTEDPTYKNKNLATEAFSIRPRKIKKQL